MKDPLIAMLFSTFVFLFLWCCCPTQIQATPWNTPLQCVLTVGMDTLKPIVFSDGTNTTSIAQFDCRYVSLVASLSFSFLTARFNNTSNRTGVWKSLGMKDHSIRALATDRM